MNDEIEADLLEQLAQENKKLVIKCRELEEQNLNQLKNSQNWVNRWGGSLLITFVLVSFGYFLALIFSNPQAYESGYKAGSSKWKKEFCKAVSKSVEDYQECL